MQTSKIKVYITLLIIIFSILICNGQNSDKIIIQTGSCNSLIAGIDNYISIIAIQDAPITENQISAFLITSYSVLNDGHH